MKKGFDILSIFVCLTLFVAVSAEIKFGELCKENGPTACESHNGTVGCIPINPNDPNTTICDCKWNKEHPSAYVLDSKNVTCVGLVESECSIADSDIKKGCIDNASCNSTTGICECDKNYMKEYENGGRKCVPRLQGYQERCHTDEEPWGCKTFNGIAPLECIPQRNNSRYKWCECPGNKDTDEYIFYNNHCQALIIGASCNETNLCYKNSHLTCSNEKNGVCECDPEYSVSPDGKLCEAPTELQDLEFNSPCTVNDNITLCKNYSGTVDCMKNPGDIHRGTCTCKGNGTLSEGYVFNNVSCIALVGSDCSDINNKCVDNAQCDPAENAHTKRCACKPGFTEVYFRRCQAATEHPDPTIAPPDDSNKDTIPEVPSSAITMSKSFLVIVIALGSKVLINS